MIKTRTYKNKLGKTGMTLVEIVLAMAILSLVIILMTPVLVSGFNMITLSGNRHVNAKNVAGEVENNLAGETVTASLHDISIQLPGDIAVDGKSYTLSQGNGARQADLNGYIIDSIPFFDPPSANTTATGATSDPAGNTETSSPVSLAMVTVDVSDWRKDTPYGILLQTTSAMEYQIYRVGSSPPQNWITCSELQTQIVIPEIPISEHAQDKGYQVVIRPIDDDTNRKDLHIRSAPPVAFEKKSNDFNLYIYNSTKGKWDAVKKDDNIQRIRFLEDPWTPDSGKKFTAPDANYIYARYAASNDLAPSLPRHVGPR